MSVRIGFSTYKPYLDVKNGKFVGPFKELIMSIYSLPFKKLNITLFPIIKGDNLVSELIQDRLDYSPFLPFLPQLYPNITSGPSIKDISCFIQSTKVYKTTSKNYDFFQSFTVITNDAAIALISFILLWILSVKVITNVNTKCITWKLVTIFFRSYRQNVHRSDSAILISTMFVYFFFVQSILLSLVNTSMVYIEEKRKLDNLRDAQKLNITIHIQGHSECIVALLLSADAQRPEIRKIIQIRSLAEKSASSWTYSAVKKPTNDAILAVKTDIQSLSEAICIFNPTARVWSDTHIPTIPVVSQPYLQFMSKHLSIKVREQINQWIYQVFQSSLSKEMSIVTPKACRQLFGKRGDLNCVYPIKQHHENVHNLAVRFSFFTNLIIFYISSIMLALIVVIVENLVNKLCKK